MNMLCNVRGVDGNPKINSNTQQIISIASLLCHMLVVISSVVEVNPHTILVDLRLLQLHLFIFVFLQNRFTLEHTVMNHAVSTLESIKP